jgi:hypothetical protein
MGDGGLLVDHASELGCERPIWWWRRWSEGRPGTRRSRCTRRVPPAEGLDDVALRVLGLRAPDRPGIVAIPIGERTDLDVAAVGLLIALSPGRLLVDVDVDVERRVMLSTSSTPLKSKPCEPADVSRLRGPEVPLRRAAGLTLGPGDAGRRGIAATLASALGAALQGVG